jgi:5,10-methylenetetrahydrofolate reductase
METANIPQNNSAVQVEPFTFFYPLVEKIILEGSVKTTDTGALKVQGFARRYPDALGQPTISVEVQFVKHLGVDVKAVLTHFHHMEDIEAAALRHAERVTFAPKPTKEAVLRAIVATVVSLKEYEPLTFLNPLTVRLSDSDHHIVVVAGLQVTHRQELVVLQGDGSGDKLEATDANAERMIAAIYKRIEKLFPNQVKPIQ